VVRPHFYRSYWLERSKWFAILRRGKEIIIGTFQAGEIFAIPPAMDGKRFPATAVAIENSSLLLVPPGNGIIFGIFVLGARMCGILRDRADTFQVLATPSAEQRVASIILRITGEMNVGEGKRIPIDGKI